MPVTLKSPRLGAIGEGGDIATRNYIHAVVFGPSGMGKTPYAAQFPKPVFLMADRNGEQSLVMTNTPYMEVRSVEDFDEAIEMLEADQFNPDRRFETVVLDTVSVFQDHVAMNLVRRLNLKNMDGFKNWGELETEVKSRLARLQNMKYNIVVLCHVQDVFGAEDRELEPLLKGSVRQSLTREFPFVIGLWRKREMVGEGEDATPTDVLRAYFQPTALYPMARTPSRSLPESLPVTFSPDDFDQIRKYLDARAAELNQVAQIAPMKPVRKPEAPKPAGTAGEAPVAAPALSSTPASDESGPVPLNLPASAERLAKKGKKEKEAVEVAEAEPTLEEAVAAVKEVLGGEEISLFDRVKATKSRSEALALYAENTDAFTDEMNAYIRDRIKNDPEFANS